MHRPRDTRLVCAVASLALHPIVLRGPSLHPHPSFSINSGAILRAPWAIASTYATIHISILSCAMLVTVAAAHPKHALLSISTVVQPFVHYRLPLKDNPVRGSLQLS